MKYSAVIFDLDGTLLDSNDFKTIAFGEIFLPYGRHICDQIIARKNKDGGIPRTERFRMYFQEYLHREITEAETEQLATNMAALIKEKYYSVPLMPGALEILQRLQAEKIPAFIATGTPQEEAREAVRRLGMSDFFCEVYGSPPGKTQVVANILRQHQLDPAQVLFYGDALADYLAATDNHIRFIGVNPKLDGSDFPAGTLIQNYLKLPE